MLLSRLWLALLPFVVTPLVMDLATIEAMQKPKNVKKESSPIVVEEADESDTADEDDDVGVDEVKEAAPLKPKESPKAQNKNSKNKNKNKKQSAKGKRQSAKERAQEKAREKAKARQEAREKAKAEKAAQKQKKIKEAFAKAEEFHKTWFNMPFPKIKASLERLTKFCKGACTKGQCGDEDVANNCHLMCPESTTKKCADPLKQAGHEGLDTEEFVQDDDESASIGMIGPVDNASPSPISSSIEQADAALKEDDAPGDGDSEEG